jgi:Zn-dependent membrane protease YugP
MTNALFALVARSSAGEANPALLWVVNGGLVLFLLGLVFDVSVLIRIGAPVMGLALIFAVFVFFTQLGAPRAETVV